MIDKVLNWMKASVDWWHELISFMLNPQAVIATIAVCSIVTLFFALRWQLMKWGRMWAGEGVLEIMFSGLVGLTATMVIYFAPLILWFTLAGVVFLVLATAFEKLVVFSVRK